MKKFILLCLLSFNVFSLTPVDGFWWNPNESGRGIAIESQNGIMVLALYGYDDSRDGRWYLGANSYNSDTNTITANWDAYDGGQCLGCSFTQTTVNEDVSKGSFTIEFTTDRKAIMTWEEEIFQLERFMFAYPDDLSYLYGIWSNTMFYSTQTSEASIIMSDLQNIDDTDYVVGHKWGSNRPAIANVTEVDDNGVPIYTMLIDSSTSFYRLYIFKANKNQTTGLGWLYQKTSQPSGSGTLTLGAKFLEGQQPSKVSNIKDINNDGIDQKIFESQIIEGIFEGKYLKNVIDLEGKIKQVMLSFSE